MPAAFKVFGNDFPGHEASVIRCLLAVQSSHVGRLDMRPLRIWRGNSELGGEVCLPEKECKLYSCRGPPVSADAVNWCLTGLVWWKGGIWLQKSL